MARNTVQFAVLTVLFATVINAKHIDQDCDKFDSVVSNRLEWEDYVFGGRHTYFTYVQMYKTTSRWGKSVAACSGTFLNDRTILTAASCVETAYKRITVAPTQWNFPIYCPAIAKVEVDVTKIVIHPKYDKATKQNNLALLKLKAPVKGMGETKFCSDLDANVCQVFQAAALPTAQTPVPKPSEQVLSCGWWTYPSGNGKVMLNMKLTGVEKDKCKAPGAANIDAATQFCAVTPEKGFCLPDHVGVPVVQLDGEGKGTLVAVASATPAAGCQQADVIYTNIVSYVDWIKANL